MFRIQAQSLSLDVKSFNVASVATLTLTQRTGPVPILCVTIGTIFKCVGNVLASSVNKILPYRAMAELFRLTQVLIRQNR